ncbi:hypothetical protein EVAR_94049_1 [Eumeta japonica]|uniref:Uncharacterized protein n=1 Tax=Eumeta variegata TaxID=151549 RepID=A0A4C1V6Y6_EUMVA|nr:hypothetical protein EVAR_94049_1 [Eumeta japonica]
MSFGAELIGYSLASGTNDNAVAARGRRVIAGQFARVTGTAASGTKAAPPICTSISTAIIDHCDVEMFDSYPFEYTTGIGVVLVTAAGLAWRLGARGGPCALLGLRRASCRRLVPRLPPSYARPHHPYAAMLYPEFHYRPPPPSYQASMHEYRLRLLLLDRSAPAVSPPPTYRSNSASLVRGASVAGWCGSEYSGPPSYRAPRVAAAVTPADDLAIAPIELKYGDELAQQLANGAEHEKNPEHLVTIVQTDAQPVIVTVSGSPALNETSQPSSEIDILAHL